MLADGDSRAQQHRVGRARAVVQVVDVHGVDPDERSPGIAQVLGGAPRHEGVLVCQVPLCSEIEIFGRAHEHSASREVEPLEERGLEPTPRNPGGIDNECGPTSQGPQLLIGKIDTVDVPMKRGIDVGSGIADELDASDLELRALRVPLSARFA